MRTGIHLDSLSTRRTGRSVLAGAAAIAWLLAGCSGTHPLEPPANPPSPPAQPAVPAPPQVLLEAPKKLEPPPTATRRVLVVVTERVGQADSPRRDPESESIISEALLSISAEAGLEVVKKGVYDEILERDFESLVQRGVEDNAAVLNNLLKAGVDCLAMGQVGASEMVRDIGRGKTLADSFHVHAGVELVRTDNAQILASANADAQEPAFRDAKTRSIRDAAGKFAEVIRAQPKGTAPLTVTITVEGLPSFAEADQISRKLRATEGVLWSREPRFSAGGAGAAPSGVARFELAWAGTSDDLRSKIEKLDAGVVLVVTKIEGTRWNYRASEKAAPKPPEAAPRPAPVPPPPPEEFKKADDGGKKSS